MVNVFSLFSDIFKKVEGYEAIDINLGQMSVQEAKSKAELIGEERNWLTQKDSNVKIESSLVKFEFSKKLVWFVYFLHTQEDWWASDKKTP